MYNGFTGAVFEGRWGSVMNAIAQLLPLEESLRNAWSLQKYTMGGHREADDEHSCKLDVADTVIRSELFWSYCKMMDLIGETFLKIMEWAEGCKCHHQPNTQLQGYAPGWANTLIFSCW